MGKPDKPDPTPAKATVPSSPNPASHCPRRLSSRIDILDRDREIDSAIGGVTEVTRDMAAALAGVKRAPLRARSADQPLGTIFGELVGAVIACLVGSTAGYAAGSPVGAAIDDNAPDNRHCLASGHGNRTAGPQARNRMSNGIGGRPLSHAPSPIPPIRRPTTRCPLRNA